MMTARTGSGLCALDLDPQFSNGSSGSVTAKPPFAASATVPVVIDCAMRPQVHPRQYILACGDANAYLTGLHWAAWGSSSAFAAGISTFNDCTPACKSGHFLRFPMLAALWRAKPLPGHAGQRYFTRLTIVYTGSRAYHSGGKPHHLPVTVTYPLSAFGGA